MTCVLLFVSLGVLTGQVSLPASPGIAKRRGCQYAFVTIIEEGTPAE